MTDPDSSAAAHTPAATQAVAEQPLTRTIVTRAIWLGLVAGIAQAIVRLSQKAVFARMRIHSARDIAWMAPLAEVILFVSVALLLALVARLVVRRRPGWGTAGATALLGTLSVWSVTLQYPQLYDWAALLLAVGAGVQLARSASGFDRVVSRTLVPLGAAVAVVAASMLLVPRWRESRSLGALPAAPAGAPNVLLLILDTVRAQSMGLYGHSRPTTPRLDAFATQGTVFDYALSTAPWTLPSHGSMFTGRYPHELTIDWLTPLDDSTPTLAEMMARHGYATAGFAGNYMMSWEVGLSRGFAHYEDYIISARQLALSSAVVRALAYWPRLRRLVGRYDSVNRKRAPELNDALLEWLGATSSRPFFAFVNYMDAHEMYNPPPPFRRLFGPDTARKNSLIRYGLGGLGYRSGKAKMTPSQVEGERAAYEESIAYLDSHLGALFDSLAARGLLDQTVVIVSSDHGEHFGEHGRWEHASSLYPQLLHVPLVMRAPGRVPAGRRIPDFVTLRDLASTVLALGPGSDELPGRSLARFWDTTGVAVGRAESPIIGSITNGFWVEGAKPSMRRGMRSVLIDGQQVIEDVREPRRFQLFDLQTDPLGQRDLTSDVLRKELVARGARQLAPVIWKSQARGVARQAGEIGTPQQ